MILDSRWISDTDNDNTTDNIVMIIEASPHLVAVTWKYKNLV